MRSKNSLATYQDTHERAWKAVVSNGTLNLEGNISVRSIVDIPDHTQFIKLKGCSSLESLPERLPDNLERLELGGCQNLIIRNELKSEIKRLKSQGCKVDLPDHWSNFDKHVRSHSSSGTHYGGRRSFSGGSKLGVVQEENFQNGFNLNQAGENFSGIHPSKMEEGRSREKSHSSSKSASGGKRLSLSVHKPIDQNLRIDPQQKEENNEKKEHFGSPAINLEEVKNYNFSRDGATIKFIFAAVDGRETFRNNNQDILSELKPKLSKTGFWCCKVEGGCTLEISVGSNREKFYEIKEYLQNIKDPRWQNSPSPKLPTSHTI
ncbi:MAG: hypothetical protein K0R25_406 [Rickettsiaceae bacterium]|jgi:hypothetical protein|nr:hypothetical protein [Rickettsiaceae bacterium]